MNEYRCHNCKALLYKGTGDVEVEVICPKCRRINYPSRKSTVKGFRGKDFQARSINHMCLKCNRLQFRSIGLGFIEVKCRYCSDFNDYDTEKIRSKKWKK